MTPVARTLTLIVLALAVAAPLEAAEKKNKKQAGNQGDPSARILKRLEKAELSEEQTAKIKELGAEYAPKLAEAQEKLGLTREQKRARRQALQENRAEGIEGKKAMKAAVAAMNLTDEQQEAMTELRKLQHQFSHAAFAVLSDEQRETAGVKVGKKQNKKNKKSKKQKKAAAE